MNIPLDRLYHYIEQLAQQMYNGNVIIYRFYPHGSKKLEDLTFIHNSHPYEDLMLLPYLYCLDQEPLNYNKYEQDTHLSAHLVSVLTHNGCAKMNIRDYPIDIWDWAILLHSEQRSNDVALYQTNQFITVYYWSHAIIARDWFRYAEHVALKKNTQKTFLIYNRAWEGTREYRLKFSELVIRLGLDNQCLTSVNPQGDESGLHYNQYTFSNPDWKPNLVLEDYFPTNQSGSYYSADFDINDYNVTDIEIVLETLFDDGRIHLTEKSLRPIACGQPFILAGTHGSLQYLRNYGFKTYNHIWNEHYDTIENPKERLIAITDLMKCITAWTPETKLNNMLEAQAIAEYNRQYFFSKEFFNLITEELKSNLGQAITQLVKENTSAVWLQKHPTIMSFLKNPDIQYLDYTPLALITDQSLSRVTDIANEYYTRNHIQE